MSRVFSEKWSYDEVRTIVLTIILVEPMGVERSDLIDARDETFDI